ncbi:Type IV fimbrial assembly, ATPase PilB [Cystobacter fuscus DSM 2262]|uniref:Type IV fimbrial assembly, ATPase PilB n=1 Tax=Cystobacter fuscus (strain ATCC 25194 / DSM 2262 / NBRC 100088 / M29) TaxID=1242864 RepID=S9QE82_CYSF2|nr:type IV fimbrial assembly, ATPase PilB [Cystobacter fuscus]EPX59614.1 Type IV fimbrial assembly, ATPase PilB [Cystobacter fuscus DSM 2262]
MAQIKLGELLIKANVLQESQLKAALAEQAKWGGKLGEILVRMNFVSEDILVRALSKQLAIPAVNLDALKEVPKHVLNRVPVQTARDFALLPMQLRDDGKTLVVAIADPLNVRQLDELRAITKCRIVPNVAGRTAIARAMARFYEDGGELEDADTNFKVVDSHGRTVVRNMKDSPATQPAPAPAPMPPMASRESPSVRSGASPVEMLRGVEEVQRKEVAALKAMVELLIEKGVFTRDEYLAKVKR